jgi:hypothetical protein
MACVYQHIRPDTNTIFYIGIGKKLSRAESKSARNRYWKNIVKKCNNVFIVEILHENISWEEACNKEKEYIGKHTPNVLIGLYKGAVKDGDAARVKLWMQIFRDFTEKQQTTHVVDIEEIKELTENNYPKMWGSASALLTIEQLEIIKSVMKGE